jgi:alkylhydroperoxidase/carboxymuconolactone decarboxylase family protein YurZ
MFDKQFVAIAILAAAINFSILYILIAAATKSKKRALYDSAQTELLVKIARQQGVPEKEIEEVMIHVN